MSNQNGESQHQFKRELSKLIRKYSAGLQTSEFAEVLGEFHSDLAQGSLHPDVEVTGDKEPFALQVSYSTAVSLEKHLDGYLEVGGVCLEVDRTLPPLVDVVLTLTGTHIDERVELEARAVQETPAGVAFQVTPPDAAAAQTLREMPATMRAAAEKRLRNAQPQAGDAAASSAAASSAAAPSSAKSPSSSPAPAASTREHTSPLEPAGEPAQTWQLQETPLPEILCGLLGREGRSVLDIDLKERRAQVVVDGPNVLDVELYPIAANESLEKLLAAAGKLDDLQIGRAREYAAQHDIAIGEALVDLDYLTYGELGVALKTRSRFLLGLLWERRKGRVARYSVDEFSRRFRAPASPLSYHLFRRMRDGFLRADTEWFDERRTFFRAHLISRVDEPPCELGDLELDEQQRHFYELVLETERPFSDILRIAHPSERQVLVLLETLRRLGMINLQQVNPFTRRRTRFLEQLESMQARAIQKSHFDLLGVHWTAHQEEIDQAYNERVESLSDERLPDQLDAETREQVEKLRASLEAAYEVLRDQKRRAEYRNDIVGRFEMKNAVEMFEKQADTAKLRRDLDGAIDACLRILEIDADHAQASRDLVVLRKLAAAEKR